MKTKIVNTTQIKEIVKVLHKGGIIIYPTETSYGIGCDATNEKAVKKIYRIKGRNRKKPLITLVQNEKMAEKYIKLNKIAKILCKKFYNTPLTLVCDSKDLPNVSGENSFRISSNKFVKTLFNVYRKPLISTSANISGNPPIFKIDEVKAFDGKVDLIVDGGNLKGKTLSTVFDTRSLEVLREGSLSNKEIFDSISSRIVICGGCFNKAHKGHEYFLKYAKSKGDYLIAVVSNDKRNREKYGSKAVSAEKRMKNIDKFKIADKVIIGNEGSIFDILKEERAGIAVLGYDQKEIPKNIIKKYGLKVFRAPKLTSTK